MAEQVTVPEEKLLLNKLIHFFYDTAEKLKVLDVNDERPDKLLLKNVEQFMMWIVMGDEAVSEADCAYFSMILDKSVTAEYVNAFTAFLREKRPNFGNELAILEPVVASDALMTDKVLDGSCLSMTTGLYSALAMIGTHLAHLNLESISGRELRLALFMGAYLARIKLEYGNQGALKDFAMREMERIYAQSFAGVVSGGRAN